MKIRMTIQKVDGKKKRLMYFREEEIDEGITFNHAVHWLLAHVNECYPDDKPKPKTAADITE